MVLAHAATARRTFGRPLPHRAQADERPTNFAVERIAELLRRVMEKALHQFARRVAKLSDHRYWSTASVGSSTSSTPSAHTAAKVPHAVECSMRGITLNRFESRFYILNNLFAPT